MKITDEDIRFMNMAAALAENNIDEGGGPFGAVIVRDGEVVATGVNRVTASNDPTAHAEMIAITAATEAMGGKYLNDCTLYVTVEPCPMCAGAIGWAQIPRIVYGCPDEKRGYRELRWMTCSCNSVDEFLCQQKAKILIGRIKRHIDSASI